MKISVLTIVLVFSFMIGKAQVTPYQTTGMGFNFSYAIIDDTQHGGVIPRFTYLFNVNSNYHFDFAKHFGVFTGYGISNVGFIAEWNDSLRTKKKFRTYNFGVPLAIKLGTLDPKKPFYFFFGAALDVPFHFKEKTFYDDKKTEKIKEWGSNRVNILQPNFFAGITFPNKTSLKFSYYPMDYLNTSFSENINGIEVRPYAHFLHSNIFLITFGAGLTDIKK